MRISPLRAALLLSVGAAAACGAEEMDDVQHFRQALTTSAIPILSKVSGASTFADFFQSGFYP